MADRVIQRNDTAARWQSINPILATGEIGIEIDGAKGYKIGDGVTRWNDLPYPANPTNVVQDLGNNENAVPSQKLVTEKLTELGSEVDNINDALREVETRPEATQSEYVELKDKEGNSLLFISKEKALIPNLRIPSEDKKELDVLKELSKFQPEISDSLEEEVILQDEEGRIVTISKKGLEVRDILVGGVSIFSVSPNLYDDSKKNVGIVYNNGTLDSSFSNYYYSDYIDVSEHTGETLFFSVFNKEPWSVRFVSAYDENKAPLPLFGAERVGTYQISSEAKYVRLSWPNTITADKQVEFGGITQYKPYGAKQIGLDVEQISGIVSKTVAQELAKTNVLYGKKWWACGDSFTEWTTEQYDRSEYPNITSVNGYTYKSYPFWIGARNNMVVHNYAVSGQTMAYPTVRDDGTPSNFKNAFSNELYKNIPNDVDYITLWFGINDSHHRPGSGGGDGESNEGVVTLGTITDTDTNTFYGAWNTVMQYLIENHPYAKIGIICTNGAETDEYALAELEIAKKWGVSFLDLNGNYEVPLMHRVNGKPLVCEKANELRKSAFWASDVNGHPNVQAQKYQSTFIENWLRSL